LCSASSLRAFNFVFEIIYPLQEFSSLRIDEALEERGIWGKTLSPETIAVRTVTALCSLRRKAGYQSTGRMGSRPGRLEHAGYLIKESA
jgi:hypothetical protein